MDLLSRFGGGGFTGRGGSVQRPQIDPGGMNGQGPVSSPPQGILGAQGGILGGMGQRGMPPPGQMPNPMNNRPMMGGRNRPSKPGIQNAYPQMAGRFRRF